MFGVSSSWQYHEDDNTVSGTPFGDKYGKDYFQFLNKLYNEKLLDPDFAIQKDQQLSEKETSGQVAVALVLMGDKAAVNAGVDKIAPGKMFHHIPMPKKEGIVRNGIDAFNPAAFQYFVKKDFKDIPRLLQYFDWFFSDEALDLKIWGPESLGLWEMKDGKKVFKDEALHQALIENKEGSIADEQYYKKGLGRVSSKEYSKAYSGAPSLKGYNPFDWERSYPYKVANIFEMSSGYVTTSALERGGKVLAGVDDLTNGPGNWLWSDFFNNKSAKLYSVKPANFDKNWEELKTEFMNKTKYAEASTEMEKVFKERGLLK
ncbi:unnamed protein product [Aphanomyces euteiches]